MVALACGMVGVGLVSVLGLLVDDRVLGGMPIWAKPFKFAVSIGLYAITWAWLTSLTTRAPRLVRRTSTGIVVLILLEMVMIVGQVVRGRASHFNNETILDHLVYRLMGATIGSVWLLTLVLSVVLAVSGIRDAATRWAIRLGAVISLIGMGFGPVMAIPTDAQTHAIRVGDRPAALGAHSVGVPDGGAAMPILGWSTTGGDLRIPHFLGMHALQLLPLLAMVLILLSARLPSLRPERTRLRLVLVAAAGFTGLLALVASQAFRGQPLIAPDGWTLAAAGLLVAGVALGTTWAWRSTDDPQWTAQDDPEPAASLHGR
jgi:hypothetical protein